jgi:chemotaxis protein histidine kinase CheA
VRLSNEPGAGLSAVIEVPIERGVVRVLWVRAGEATYALPARQVRRVFFAEAPATELALPLAACVRGLRAIVAGEALGSADAPSFVVELDAGREDEPSFFVSVDAVGDMEEVALHAPPPLVAAAGPYNGAIVRGDAVVLCLDVLALGELVHLVHGRRA